MTVWLTKETLVGGEIGKILHGRDDLFKVEAALEAVENFFILAEGAVARAPGTIFVGELKNEGERGLLISFDYGKGYSYQLVLNGGVMRVVWDGSYVTDGGSIYELAVPWAEADLPNIRYKQDKSTIFTGDISTVLRPKEIFRRDHTDWEVRDYVSVNGPTKIQNLDEALVVTASATTGEVTLTTNFDCFLAGDEGSSWRFDEGDLSATPLWKANTTVAVGNKVRNAGKTYQVTAGTNSGVNAPVHEEGAVKSGSDTATFLYLYKNEGFARIKTVVGPREAVADVQTRLPDDVATTGTYRWYRGAWSDTDGWPALPVIAPCLGPRIWWFRNNELWFSVGYDWWDFEAGLGDDDGYGTSIGSPDGSLVEFRWAMADKVLVVGGKSNEWVARTQNAYDVATPSNVRMFNEEDKGSADHIPTRLSGGVAFLSRDRKELYFCRVDMLAEKLAVQKLTRYYREALCSPGVGLAWQRAPNNLLFVPREDGQMLMVVLDEEQKVLAISRRITRGVIEDVCVSPSPDDAVDDVYLIVRRVIDGVTRRYLERVAPYFSASCSAGNTAEGAVYFDAALTYEGPATTRLLGFDHLIGEEIGLLVNGKAHPRRIVDAEGGVDLAFEATSAVGGLPIDARLKSLPLETATDEGTTRFRNRRASRVVLDLFETLGGTVKVNDGRAFPIQTGGGRDPSAPPSLLDGQIGVGVEDDWSQTTQVEIEAGDGMPMTVRGFAVKAELGAR